MPIINGQKVACAPCIRGHRSTKCNHSSERVMVPVRKPGRPLSSCPCPPGRPCGCGGVKVAIPRRQKCGCGSGNSKEADPEKAKTAKTAEGDDDGHEDRHPPSLTPTSPVNPFFRVSKPVSSATSRSRKQTFEGVLLDRIDPQAVNMISSYGDSMDMTSMGMVGESLLPQLPMAGLAEFEPAGLTSGMAFIGPLATDAYSQDSCLEFVEAMSYGMPTYLAPVQLAEPPKLGGSRMPKPMPMAANGPGGTVLVPPVSGSGNETRTLNGPHQTRQVLKPKTVPRAPETNGKVGENGCGGDKPAECGSKSRHAPPPPPPPPLTPQTSVLSASPQDTPLRGAFMPSADDRSTVGCCGKKSAEQLSLSTSPVQAYDEAFETFHPPMDMRHQTYHPTLAFPTIYTYPANYGSWQNPVSQALWQQLATQPSLSLDARVPDAANGHTDASADAHDLGTSHQCSCGPGCQCVGCLAHPFNDQMFEYVTKAYSDVTVANGATPAAAPPTAGQAASETVAESPPEQPPTPSDVASDEQSLSSSDFFFVNIPYTGIGGGSCAGSGAFCPCGDDCQCDGCLVHTATDNTGPASD